MVFDQEINDLEQQAPEYIGSQRLSLRSKLLRRDAMDSNGQFLDSPSWVRCYKETKQHQMRVNHHIHRNNDNGEREPMPYCRSKDILMKCTKGYPRKKYGLFEKLGQKYETGAAVCTGLAKIHNWKASGRRSMLGAIVTGRNNE